jgi:hypothetical protein
MAKSPNTTPISSMFAQWSQPYVAMEGFFQGKDCGKIYEALSVEQEIDALDKADEAVQKMLTYPDADAILNKIRKESK